MLWLRQLSRWLERARIVDLDRSARLQFELAAGDHLLASLHAFEDGDPVALGRSDTHETALDSELGRGRNGAARIGIGRRRRRNGFGRDGGSWLCGWLRRALIHHPDAGAIETVGHGQAR